MIAVQWRSMHDVATIGAKVQRSRVHWMSGRWNGLCLASLRGIPGLARRILCQYTP